MMDEMHHAFIVSEFYAQLKQRFSQRGIGAFVMGAQTYGEQRGKRMAMRATADGHALDYEGYFAYGEYASTDAYFDVEMWSESGTVHEKVTRCPWAKMFAERGMKECGNIYCREIDRAIVRGFNPELELETASTQHEQGCCRFYFRDKAVTETTLEDADRLCETISGTTMPLAYHCAHVFTVFAHTAEGVFGHEGCELADAVMTAFEERYGKETADELRKQCGQTFDKAIRE